MLHRKKIFSQYLQERLRKVNDKPVRITDHSGKGWTKHLSNTLQQGYCFSNTFSRTNGHCISLNMSMKCRRIFQTLCYRVYSPDLLLATAEYSHMKQTTASHGLLLCAGLKNRRPAHVLIFTKFHYPFAIKQQILWNSERCKVSQQQCHYGAAVWVER